MRSLLPLLCLAGPALADPPAITDAEARDGGSGWTFRVTLAHPDTGWDHYADGWRIETAEGRVLGTRGLAHPHVTEQPFTRSLSGVDIPEAIETVYIRAKCSVDGWNADRVAVNLR